MFSRFAKAIRNNIIVGLILIAPLVLTVFIVNWSFTFITNRVLPEALRTSEHELLFRAAALLSVLVILFLIGWLTRYMLGKQLYRFGDTVISRVPGINKIYLYVRQISEAVVAQRQAMFKQVVAVEYPRKGLYSMAFVTAVVPPKFRTQIKPDESDEMISLFIPTTPNPTSGILIFVPRKDTRPLPIQVGDAMKLVISGGVAYPGAEHPDAHITMLDKLEQWLNPDASKEPSANKEQDDQHVDP